MDHKEFEQLVMKAIERLPQFFKDKLENVDIIIEDEPDFFAVRKMGLGAKGRLLGLYQGVPLKNRTHYYGMVLPDKITLFRSNIERSCNSAEDIRDRISHVIKHEIAHHFGISDRRLRDLDIY